MRVCRSGWGKLTVDLVNKAVSVDRHLITFTDCPAASVPLLKEAKHRIPLAKWQHQVVHCCVIFAVLLNLGGWVLIGWVTQLKDSPGK